LQFGRYTTETAKEVGKLIKQSPAKIENLFFAYTGGLGKYALDASDKLLKRRAEAFFGQLKQGCLRE